MYDTLVSQTIDDFSYVAGDDFSDFGSVDFVAKSRAKRQAKRQTRGQAGRSLIKGFIAKLKAAGFALTTHAGERIAQRLQSRGIRLNAREFARAFLTAKHYRQRGRNTRISLVGGDIPVVYILTGRAGRIAGRRPLLVTVYPSLSAGGRLPAGVTPIAKRALNFRLDMFDSFGADAYEDESFWDEDDNIDQGKRRRRRIPTHWDNLTPGQRQQIEGLCRARAKRSAHRQARGSTKQKHQEAIARKTRECVRRAKRDINSGKIYSDLVSQLEP